MALTMTRTRTQSTLTKLAEMVANVQGELAFLDELLEPAAAGAAGSKGSPPELYARLAARRLQLVSNRDALYATVRQFDGRIDPHGIGIGDGWRTRFGNRRLGMATLTVPSVAWPGSRRTTQISRGLTKLP